MLLTPLHDKVLEWHCNPLQHSAMLSIQLQRPGSELFSLALLKQVFPHFHYSGLGTTVLFPITREAAGIGCDPRITRPSASRFFSGVRARLALRNKSSCRESMSIHDKGSQNDQLLSKLVLLVPLFATHAARGRRSRYARFLGRNVDRPSRDSAVRRVFSCLSAKI